ncbi:MAG TPA: hypothetical protein PKI62_06030 [bacterium]|nr:hypothetical protein [bacterium]
MNRLVLGLLAGCAAVLLQCRESFVPFTLADPGAPCTIVVPARTDAGAAADPDAPIRLRAAAELRHYLARMLGRPDSAIAVRTDAEAVNGRILFLGRPGAKSHFATAARRLDKAQRRSRQGADPAWRWEGWSDEQNHYLAITARSDVDLLRAVYAFLDEQGVRFLFPGAGGVYLAPRHEIRVLQAVTLPPAGLELCGLLPTCPEGGVPADSASLRWWARQRFTHLPAGWADPDALHRLGLAEVRRCEAPAVWKPGFCCSDSAALRQLITALFSGRSGTGLYLLDAAAAAPLCSCTACLELGTETDRWLYLTSRIGAAMTARKNAGTLPAAANLLALGDLELPQKFAPREWPRSEVLLAARIRPRCYNHALADPRCVEVNAGALAGVVKWLAASPYARHALVDTYYAAEFAGLPLLLDSVVAQDLATCRSLGVQGFFCDAPASIRPDGIRFYQDYLLGQALQQPHLNADSLRQAFVAFAFPGAASMTLEYLNMVGEAFANAAAWRGELPGRVRQLAAADFNGALLPLERFHHHFNLYQVYADSNEGVAWERTFQLVHDARHVMDEMLEGDLPDPTLDRLLAAEKQLRFAELIVTFYDNIIRSLTLGEDEPAMREEAAIRLRQVVQRMEQFTVEDRECGGGKVNALRCSGLEECARALLDKLQQRYRLPYDRVYEE